MTGMKFSMDGAKTSYRVVTNKIPLPHAAPDDYTSGAFCIKVSPEWFWILQGAMELFEIRALWEWSTNEEWLQLRQWLLKLATLPRTCEEPEPCEECPELPEQPERPPMGGGGSWSLTGALGYTIDELEEMLQMAVTKIEMRPDGLYYRDGCCDWYKVEFNGVTGGLGGLLTPSSKPLDQWTLQDWADAGKPSLPSVGVIPHANPAYNTQDVIRCAKASALAAYMFGTLTIIKAAFIALAATAPTVTPASVTTALLAAGITGGWSIAAGAAALIAGYIVAEDLGDWIAEIDGWLDDSALLSEYVCTLTGAVYPGEEIEEIDVDQMIKYWLVTIGEDQNHWFFDIMRTFPVQWYKLGAQPLVAEQECGCENFLPYGYEPPAMDGLSIAFERLAYVGSVAYGTAPSLTGLPYEAAFTNGQTGTLVSGKPKTVFTGTESTWSNTAFGAIFKLSNPAQIAKVKPIWSYPNGENEPRLWMWYFDSGAGTWAVYQASTLDSSSPFMTEYEAVASPAVVTQYILLVMKTRYPTAGAQKSIQLVDIEISGIYGGNGFEGLGLGEVFNP